jgi:hypothetical protein
MSFMTTAGYEKLHVVLGGHQAGWLHVFCASVCSFFQRGKALAFLFQHYQYGGNVDAKTGLGWEMGSRFLETHEKLAADLLFWAACACVSKGRNQD